MPLSSKTMSVYTAGSDPGPILGIESSCDETAAAVLDTHGRVLSNIISSQVSVHEKFGGIVPELAARAHVTCINGVVRQAMAESRVSWNDLGGVAVTTGPGLAGALLVGVSYAKALAYGVEVPLICVNHLEGHIASAWLADSAFPRDCVVLVVSGGHTHLYRQEKDGRTSLLGRTRDDAAGEAFDKGAQMLGLAYPGGPAIDRLAREGNPNAISFPQFQQRRHQLEFSFSGLKTSLLYKLRDMPDSARTAQQADLAASYQEAIVQVLVRKAFAALASCRVNALAVVGGVSANSRLRTLLMERAAREGIRLALPPLAYCTDNAAMIAAAGRRQLLANSRSLPQFDVDVATSGKMVHGRLSEEPSHS